MNTETKINEHNLGHLLKTNRLVKVAEIILLFGLAMIVILLGLPLAEGDMLRFQGVLWIANVLMLLYIWMGLRLRGQGWGDLGLRWKEATGRPWWKTCILVIAVALGAATVFMVGAIIMGAITGVPEQADMSGYTFLKGNVGLFLLTMAGVYIVSSLGEEIVYRAFLMRRIAEISGETQGAWHLALVIAALVFGLAHYSWGVTGIVQTTLMGAFLGWTYLRFGRNLWINVLAHAVLDTILMGQVFFGP